MYLTAKWEKERERNKWPQWLLQNEESPIYGGVRIYAFVCFVWPHNVVLKQVMWCFVWCCVIPPIHLNVNFLVYRRQLYAATTRYFNRKTIIAPSLKKNMGKKKKKKWRRIRLIRIETKKESDNDLHLNEHSFKTIKYDILEWHFNIKYNDRDTQSKIKTGIKALFTIGYSIHRSEKVSFDR